MHMKKKLLVTAIAATTLSSGAFATVSQTQNNDANLPVIAPSGSVNAENLYVIADGGAGDFPVDNTVTLRLPTGVYFNSAPTAKARATGGAATPIADGGAATTLLLNDAVGDGSTTGAVVLSDLDGDGKNERATVTINRAPAANEAIQWAGLNLGYSGTATKNNVSASVLVVDKSSNTLFIDTTNDIATHVPGLSTPLWQEAADSKITVQFQDTNDRALASSSFIFTLPAQTTTTANDLIRLMYGPGIENAVGGTVFTVTPLTDGAPALTVVAPTAGANTHDLTVTGSVARDSQYRIGMNQVQTDKDVTGAALGTVAMSLASTSEVLAGSAGDTIAVFAATGSSASLLKAGTTTAGAAANTKLTRGAARAVTIVDDIAITEIFDNDIATGDITIVPSTGTTFNTGAAPAFVQSADLTLSQKSFTASKLVLTATNDGAPDGSADTVRIQGLQLLAATTAGDSLSLTIGGATGDTANAPKSQVLPVATSEARGTATVGGATAISVGPGTSNAVNTFSILEGTYGALTTTGNTQSSTAFVRLTPSTNATLDIAQTTATGISSGAAGTFGGAPLTIAAAAGTAASLNNQNIAAAASTAIATIPATTSGVFNVNTESSARSLVRISAQFDVKSTAAVGDTVTITVDGDAGASGVATVANVVVPTKATATGTVPQVTSSTESQTLGTVSIKEQFTTATTNGGTFRIIAPAGVSFDPNTNAGATVTGGNVTGVSTTFNANDTLTLTTVSTAAIDTVTVKPEAFISSTAAAGSASFSIVNGDKDAKNGAGVSAETVSIAHVGSVGAVQAGDATAAVSLGFPVSRTITGGLAPYTVASATAAAATAAISGSTLTITPVAAGSSVITVTDALNQTDTVTATVAAGASEPARTTVASDGTTTTATITGGVTADNGATFSSNVAVGSSILIKATINPAAGDVGSAASIIVAVQDPTTGGVLVVNSSGQFVPVGDPVAAFESVTALAATQSVDVTKGVPFTVTSAEAGQTFNVFVGYQKTGGPIIFNSAPIVITVAQ